MPDTQDRTPAKPTKNSTKKGVGHVLGIIGGIIVIIVFLAGIIFDYATLRQEVKALQPANVSELVNRVELLDNPMTGKLKALNDNINGAVKPLVGEIRMWSGPYEKLNKLEAQGWFWCDGGAINRANDKGDTEFFKLVGVNYGVGDQTKSFNLPDFRDESPMGAAATGSEPNSIGRPFSNVEGKPAAEGGLAEVTLLRDQLPPHRHKGTTGGGSKAQLQQNEAGTNFHPKIYAGYAGQGGPELGGPPNPIGRVPSGEYLHRNWPGMEHTHNFETDDDLTILPSPVNNVHPYFAVWYLVYAGPDTKRIPPDNHK